MVMVVEGVVLNQNRFIHPRGRDGGYGDDGATIFSRYKSYILYISIGLEQYEVTFHGTKRKPIDPEESV